MLLEPCVELEINRNIDELKINSPRLRFMSEINEIKKSAVLKCCNYKLIGECNGGCLGYNLNYIGLLPMFSL